MGLVAQEIAMPRLSDSMEEGVVIAWLKSSGDSVAKGEPLVEIETDKATMVYEAESDGVLGELLAAEGDTVALGAALAVMMVEGESPAAAGAQAAPESPDPDPAVAPAPAVPRVQAPAAGAETGRVRATPVARRVAADLGVDLASLVGSGPGGRIVRKDVLAAGGNGAGASSPMVEAAGERLELSATQRTIVRRMVASRSEIPDFTVTFEIDMTAALRLRGELNDLPDVRVSVNDMIVRAAAITLREQPALNSWWVDEGIVRQSRVSVGVAVASGDDTLLVPTIADADRKSLFEIAREARAAGERARARASTPAELSGATFTISNLGMFGTLCFDAVINPPQVAILAVGSVVRRPHFDATGAVVPRDLMQVSLCSDHRAVYGATAARFLARLREILEQPVQLTLPLGGASDGGKR